MARKVKKEDLDLTIDTTSLESEPSLDNLHLNEENMPKMEPNRLREFMNEPVILDSGPSEPISPGEIGYSRENEDSSIIHSPKNHSRQRLPGLDTANSSFLAPPPLSPTDIDGQSDIESIRSFDSDSSASSSQSSVNARLEAVADFISFLTTDKVLQPLYREAVGVMSAGRFQRNFGRLLRIYARQLKRKASDNTEKAIAMFVRQSALSAAIAVTRHFFPEQEKETLLHELVTLPPKSADLVETCLSRFDERPGSKHEQLVSDQEDDGASFVSGHLDDSLPEDSERITKFMVNSKAFSHLQENLKAFLASKAVSEYDAFTVDQDDGADALADPPVPGVLTRRATQAQLDEEQFFRELSGISTRTSTGLSEEYSEWPILHYILLFWVIMKQYYILTLQYLLSLAPPSDLERLNTSRKEFQPAENWKVIYLYDAENEAKEATVRLDTGADLNVISMQKVQELGKQTLVQHRVDRGVFVRSANGQTFEPRGSLILRWSLKRGSKIYKEEFFVIENCPEEVLFGNRYIQELQLLESRWPALLLTVWDKKPKQTDADKEAEKRRQEEKKALEEKKRAEAAQPPPLPFSGNS